MSKTFSTDIENRFEATLVQLIIRLQEQYREVTKNKEINNLADEFEQIKREHKLKAIDELLVRYRL